MADYNIDLSAPTGAGASPVAAVAPIRGEAPNPWANVVAAGINLFAGLKEKQAKEEKEAQDAAITNAFVRENTAINDAVAAGQMDRSQASVRQRAIFSKYSAQYPTKVKTFGELNRDLLAGTELGEFKEEEQASQDAERKLEGDMINAGMPITKDMNPATRELFKTSYLVNRRADQEFERNAKRVDAANKVAAEDRARFKFEAEVAVADGLNKMGSSTMPAAMSYVSDLAREAAGGVEARKAAMIKHGAYFAGLKQQIARISVLNPALASNWEQAFDELRNSSEKVISGELDAKLYKNQQDSLMDRITSMALMNSPKLQGLAVTNRLLQGAFSVQAEANQEAINTLNYFAASGGVEGTLPQAIGTENESFLIGSAENSIKRLKNGTSIEPEVEKKQVSNLLANYTQQFSDVQASGSDPKKLAKAMDFFGSSTFREAMSMGLVSKQQATVAAQTNSLYFEQKIAPQIEQKLGTAFEGVQSYGDLVDIKWGGAAPVVVPLDRYMSPEQATTRNRLINDLKPAMEALGKVTRAGAHLEGHSDYAKFFTENLPNWLPSYYSAEGKVKTPGRDTGVQPIKGVVQRVAREDLVAGKTRIGNHLYIGPDPDQESSWQKQ